MIRPAPSPSRSRHLRPGRATFARVAGVLVLLLLSIAYTASPASSQPSGVVAVTASARSLANVAPANATFPPPIDHLIVVMMENKSTPVALGEPYEAYLAHRYAFASNFYAIAHSRTGNSGPSQLAATSGLTLNEHLVYNQTNVGDLLESRGLTWDAFLQNMPVACDAASNISAGYDANHNPFIFYADVIDNGTRCSAHDLPFTNFTEDLAAGTLPNYAFISPNVSSTDEAPTAAAGDRWLAGWLAPLINDSTLFAHTAVLVTYDEASYGNATPVNGTTGGPVYTVVVSPYAEAGYNSTQFYTTTSILTTTEWLFDLGRTGANDNWSVYPPMADLFTSTASVPYAFQGTVTNVTGGAVANATVSFASINDGIVATTAGNGVYTAGLPNGTYQVIADAPTYAPASTSFTVDGDDGSGPNFVLVPLPYYPVIGTITSSTGLPVPSATLTFVNVATNLSRTVATGANGTFSVALQNGTYHVTATAAGYLPGTRTLVVAGADTGIQLALLPVPPPAQKTIVPKSLLTPLIVGALVAAAIIAAVALFSRRRRAGRAEPEDASPPPGAVVNGSTAGATHASALSSDSGSNPEPAPKSD